MFQNALFISAWATRLGYKRGNEKDAGLLHGLEREQGQARYGGFSEGDLVEKPAIELFESLGWKTANLFGEFGRGGGNRSSEGRESKRQAFLPNRLWQALRLLNPSIDEASLGEACSILARDRGAVDPVRANAEFHSLLLNGIKIRVRGPDGALIDETVRVGCRSC